MATDREYQEWQKYRGKPPKKKGSFPTLFFFLGILLGGFLLNQQSFFYLFSKNNLNTFTFEKLDKNLLPSSIVISQQVKNPVAGAPQILSLANANQLDQQAASIIYTGSSVKELAEILTPFASTEAEKARIIYAWITQHIAYDVQSVLRDRHRELDLSSSGVLKSKLTICSGYANLYQALAKSMGLEAVIIEGYGKGPSYLVGKDKDINHAWNGVKINKNWYLIDTTWGAGAINNKQFKASFNPYYFATLPSELIYSHFPSESKWQLLPTIYTRTEFDKFPDISARFFRDKLQLFSHQNNSKILANERLEIRLTAPENILIAAQLMSESGTKLEPTYTFVQKQGQQTVVNVSFPSIGKYELIIFSKNKQEETYIQAIKYNIQSTASGEPFPLTYASFAEKEAYLETPLTQSLPIDTATYFQVKVSQASKVVVVNKKTNNWTELTPNKNFFAGSVVIEPGKMMVAAQFPGSNQYWTLLEYN